VSARFLAGLGAWVVGAGAATGGSLFAVSLLGQSLSPAPTQQLTVAAVNHALHNEAVAAAKAARARPTPSPSPTESTPPPVHLKIRRSPKPTPSPTPSPSQASEVISSAGGTVTATCIGAHPHLSSWIPQQGYQIQNHANGSTEATVTFGDWQSTVIVQVTCVNGVPSAVVYVNGGDGGGGPGGGDYSGPG
jgi:hypothetical protein